MATKVIRLHSRTPDNTPVLIGVENIARAFPLENGSNVFVVGTAQAVEVSETLADIEALANA